MAFVADVLMHGGIFAIFLISFFYTFVVFIQKVAMNRDIRNIMDDYLEDIFLVSNDLQRKGQITAIDAFIKNAGTEASKEQSSLDSTNKEIVKKSILLGILPAVAAIIIAILITYFSGESLTEFILQNLITLAFIMISEFIIVALFLNSFAILDSSFIKATFITQSHETNIKECEYVREWLKNKGLSQWAL
jgi:hypothetical protein